MNEKIADLSKIKDSEIIRTRQFGKVGSGIIFAIGMVCSIFHLFVLLIRPIDPWYFRSLHIAFMGILCFLLLPGWKKSNMKRVHLLDFLFMALLIIPVIYIFIEFDEWIYRVGVTPTTMDTIISLLFIIAVLEMTRRTTGLGLTIIVTIFIFYGYFGKYLPGLLYHKGYTWGRILTYLFSLDGILGMPIFVSAAYVYIFVLFGAFLKGSGVGNFFIEFANALVGWARGGPAKVAIISSSLFGTVSGSSAANVVGTGSFTIPMMKKIGYKPHFAGAVEAVASTGGQIMPPVMGAGAFLMAEILGIPYLKVLTAAILPAIMYYVAVYFMVDFEAAKTGLVGLSKDQLPSRRETFKKIYMFFPLGVLVYYIAIAMASIIKAGTMAITACIVISFFQVENRFNAVKIIKALADGAKGAVEIAGTCAAAGIVIGIIAQTGVGLKFATILLTYSKDIFPLALFLSMVVAIILGMGMPTTAAYAICAAVITAGLQNLGAIPIAAHLFVFYFACISAITPPVALAAYAGAAIAGSHPNKVGFTAMKLGLAAFIAPYMFIFNPAMLLIGKPAEIIQVIITSLIGTYALACAAQGWLWGRPTSIYYRVPLFLGAILLIDPKPLTDLIGILILSTTFIVHRLLDKKRVFFPYSKSIVINISNPQGRKKIKKGARNKMKRLIFTFISIFLFILAFFSLSEAQLKKDWGLKGVTLGAAPVGGVYYVWAGGPAKILGEIMGIPTSVESTGGPVHNTQLVNSKELHFGMVTAAPAYEGWHGLGWAKGKKHQNIRAIFPMYTSYFHMYALKKTGITKIRDCAGKVVGTGPIGGTPSTYWPLLFEANGIKPKRIVNASFSDLDNQLKDGLLDSIGQVVGIPVGTILSAETTHEIVILGVEDDVATNFIKKYPYFSKGIIPKGTYKSAPNDLSTICLWNFFITYKEMPGDLVYEFTKEIFKNKDLLVKVHKSAQEVEMKNILFSPIPLHPGAIKYYEENGLKIPKELKL